MTAAPDPATPLLPDGLRPGGRFDQWRAPAIAWLACDADGTLLGPDDLVSDPVASALRDVHDRGTRVGIVTGRMRQGAARIHERFPVPGPHVLHNGAEVRLGGETLVDWPLDDDAVATLLDIAVTHDAYGELYTSTAFYTTREHELAWTHWRSLGVDPSGRVSPEAPPTDPVLKATFVGWDEREAATLEAAFHDAGLTVGSAGSMAHTERTYINVTAPGIDKAHAIIAAAEHLGLGVDHVAMIGDGDNDLPALAAVGTAVAMGQAAEHVRAAAHLVTDAVTDDGVAAAVRALGLLG